ncbi:AbrB/MazE/SpoVT family DNA-binding domain-containing protein [Priestia aryabhattai]|uniref:AbrB/MazE/SpoVT family DNA-binding domain-containing protein n=1 Tax=Priestia aryabhattai TaxID=412384 RepID=UPI001C0CAF46|nr:AbrB/MazE/SpoVT family DNA-binding domain-containing protein [Priestia aryabhattai]MBU3569297.1 AbrB/MazE/SpoVT family DNA-binding domain-containing protein [Priestia aryabhattai]
MNFKLRIQKLGKIHLPDEIITLLNISKQKNKSRLEFFIHNADIVARKFDYSRVIKGLEPITRNIDRNGYIIIPKQIREKLSLREGDYLEIHKWRDTIVMKKTLNKTNSVKKCLVTGEESENNFEFLNGKLILSKEGVGQLISEIESKFLYKNKSESY